MLLTKWDEVENWVRTNGYKRVVVRTSDRNASTEDTRTNDTVFDSKNAVLANWNEKMDHLRWVLEHSDRKVYATGFQSESAGTGGMAAEILLEKNAGYPQIPVGMPGFGTPADEASIVERVTKQLETKYASERLERERQEFESERKEFNEVKNGMIGLLVEYGRPILGAMAASGKRPMVAGIDQPGHTEAEPIVPANGAEEAEEEVFTDAEAEEMYDLMARFKKVEPDYMQLLRSVVAMAESGDSTYTMARGFLIKK